MKKTGIFYGSSTGNTKAIAQLIGKKLGAPVYDVAKKPQAEFESCDLLVLGTSTWGLGDLQDDWDDFLGKLKSLDLTGKTVALFGLGDSGSYPDTFVDGMGHIYQAFCDKGCTFVGQVDSSDYEFDDSQALVDGKFIGLALDEENEGKKTEQRLTDWLTAIQAAVA